MQNISVLFQPPPCKITSGLFGMHNSAFIF
jgi:hypothetical protein